MARVMITLPDELLEQVDQTARAEQRNRSEFVQEAVQYYLKSRLPHQPVSTLGAVGVIERLRTQALEHAAHARDSTEIVRSFRETG